MVNGLSQAIQAEKRLILVYDTPNETDNIPVGKAGKPKLSLDDVWRVCVLVVLERRRFYPPVTLYFLTLGIVSLSLLLPSIGLS